MFYSSPDEVFEIGQITQNQDPCGDAEFSMVEACKGVSIPGIRIPPQESTKF